MNTNQNEEIDIFLEECTETLTDFDALLVEYEKNKDKEIITKLKRMAHSIKGSSGILGLSEIQSTAHKIEDLILELPESPKNINNKISEILNLTKEISELIENSKQNNSKTSEEIFNEIIKNITLLKTDLSVSQKINFLINDLKREDLSQDGQESLNLISKIFNVFENSKKIKDSSIINILSGAVKTIKKIIINNENTGELLLINQKLALAYQMIDGYLEKKEPEKIDKIDLKRIPSGRRKVEINVLNNLEQGTFRTLRVETSKIDILYSKIQNIENKLFCINKDLITFTNAFKQLAEKIFDLEVVLNSLSKIDTKENKNPELSKMQKCTGEIQNIMRMFENIEFESYEDEHNILNEIAEIKKSIKDIRILPIGVILHMFPRMVRDIAQNLSKEVDIEITGGQINVDKSVIEEIKIPIIHLLRNAVDHGIELPEEREKLNKPRAGKITISVNQSEGRVLISVKDDGRGIDIKKIKAKAIKEKIIDKSHVNKLSQHDFLNMIFRPGFSTEDKVTELSGRGMGLDIVNNKVTSLNGKIQIITEKGFGTEIILDLPIESNIIAVNKEINKKPVKLKKDKTIIVVDDSRATRMHFSKILEDYGFNCLTFEFAEDALKKLKNTDCDLIISDIEMPKMNGYDFIAKIRKDKKLKDVPVIVISMLTEEKVKDKFKKTKISSFINKSDFNKEKLINIINKLI